MPATDACPCGREKSYEQCCGPLHRGERTAVTAEDLLRSRYSAFVMHEIDFLLATAHPETRREIHREDIEAWSKNSKWYGLTVGAVIGGKEGDDDAAIEFVASYRNEEGKDVDHHERSFFARVEGEWRFVDGEPTKPEPVRRAEPKVGRNDPCPCGSGRKFKKCCGKEG